VGVPAMPRPPARSRRAARPGGSTSRQIRVGMTNAVRVDHQDAVGRARRQHPYGTATRPHPRRVLRFTGSSRGARSGKSGINRMMF
jgi:hypothetical protein